MNKYNVRAIRKELDDYVRHFSWKKFRIRFQALSKDLQQAVVEHKSTTSTTHHGSSKQSSKSLLHALCHCVQNAHPPVPIDLLEAVLHVCPHALLSTSPTPLSIALDRQASPSVIECLLWHDDPNISTQQQQQQQQQQQALYIFDGKGETPILQAVKQSASDEIIQSLIQHDPMKQSLLIASKKRHRVPLFYVINQELSFCNLNTNHVVPQDEELPEELQYMLLQTFQALEIRDGRRTIVEAGNGVNQYNEADEETYDDYDHSVESESEALEDSSTPLLLSQLQATIACAHFMGDKNTCKLLQFLISKTTQIPGGDNGWGAVDEHGDSLLHCVCRATHKFLAPIVHPLNHDNEALSLLDFLILKHPQGLLTFNAQGKLPLHVAIQATKPWEFLKRLNQAAPESVTILTQQEGRLPLHLALLCYSTISMSLSREISELWKLHPDAATIADTKERLFPFQLAALSKAGLFGKATTKRSSSANNQTDSRSKNKVKEALSTVISASQDSADLDQLSTIFFLLRASPQVLRNFV